MSVTAPAGFAAAGVDAGLVSGDRPDLGFLAVPQGPATAAGAFTTNRVAAAPVLVSRRRLGAGRARAIVVNAGQANAGTGPEGIGDAERTSAAAAGVIDCDPEEVLVCSTGVIGPRVPVGRIEAALPAVREVLSPAGGGAFARAILTTDAGPKEAVEPGRGFTVGGCAKGAGMVAPALATMLAFVTTDAAVEPGDLARLTRDVVAPAFNGLTIDGCTSTNDAVLVLASGASGIEARPGTAAGRSLEEALGRAAESLVRQLAGGAEGAETVLVVGVSGAASDDAAQRVAQEVAGSLLVKTAIFGSDPNPGRLLQAVGAAGIELEPTSVDVRLGGIEVVRGGRVVAFDETRCREAMKKPEVVIEVALGAGSGTATCFGCDLGYDYIQTNAEYTT